MREMLNKCLERRLKFTKTFIITLLPHTAAKKAEKAAF